MTKVPQTILDNLDSAKFSWYHFKAILVTGVGFFTDAYDVFIINLVALMISILYFEGSNQVPPLDDGLIKTSASVGTLCGQLLFGYLSDKYGRKKMYGLELVLMIWGTIGTAIASDTRSGLSMIAIIAAWRFVMGQDKSLPDVPGGDYPVSAVMTSEFANTKNRGAMVSAVFSMQGGNKAFRYHEHSVGIVFGSLVSLIVVFSFQDAIINDINAIDTVWRICLSVGIIPALVAIYFRATMPESPRYTLKVQNDLKQAILDVKSVHVEQIEETLEVINAASEQNLKLVIPDKSLQHFFSSRKNTINLFACSACWFLLDVAFYGLQLNQSIVLSAIGWTTNKSNNYELLKSNIIGNLILAFMGTFPGYFFSVFLMDVMGRKTIQLMGFFILAADFLIISFTFDSIGTIPKLILFVIGFFFFNFGPNATTFIYPSEVFPTKFRSTGHGFSAASGKLGAIIATLCTPLLNKAIGFQWVMFIYGLFMAMGFGITFLLPETAGKTLEEISDDTVEYEHEYELADPDSEKI